MPWSEATKMRERMRFVVDAEEDRLSRADAQGPSRPRPPDHPQPRPGPSSADSMHFRTEYNHERPHQTLQDRLPAELYCPSPRPFPQRLPQPEYPGHFEVRRVSRNGGIRWKHGSVNVSTSLLEENVGLEEIDDGVWSLYFGPLRLGRFNERTLRIEDHLGRTQRRAKVLPMSRTNGLRVSGE
jgi:hypothetical protein